MSNSDKGMGWRMVIVVIRELVWYGDIGDREKCSCDGLVILVLRGPSSCWICHHQKGEIVKILILMI